MRPLLTHSPANDHNHSNLQDLRNYLAGAVVSAHRCRQAAGESRSDERSSLLAAADRYDELTGRYAAAVDRAERQARRAYA